MPSPSSPVAMPASRSATPLWKDWRVRGGGAVAVVCASLALLRASPPDQLRGSAKASTDPNISLRLRVEDGTLKNNFLRSMELRASEGTYVVDLLRTRSVGTAEPGAKVVQQWTLSFPNGSQQKEISIAGNYRVDDLSVHISKLSPSGELSTQTFTLSEVALSAP
jgi:hypothetical protein